MPSPLNTPTSDQDSKSLFDSNENLNSLNSATNNNHNHNHNVNDGGGGGKKLMIIINEDLTNNNNNETLVAPNEEPIKPTQSPPPIKEGAGQDGCGGGAKDGATLVSSPARTESPMDDDQSIWQNSSLKFRRARLNLNLVPLNNLSLPQIIPAALPSCYQNNHANNNSSSGGGKCGTSLSSSLSYNDCFRFDGKNHHHHHHNDNRTMTGASSSSALTDRDSTLLLIQTPRLTSPKYNAHKFEPIISSTTNHGHVFGQHSSLDNVISDMGQNTGNGGHGHFNGFGDQHSSSLGNINNNNNDSGNEQNSNNNTLNNSKNGHHLDPFQIQRNPRKYGKYSEPNVKCFEYQNAIRIDPNLDIEQQEWFHGYVSRKEAEKILANQPVGTYLVRDWRHQYIISLKSIFGCIHFRLFHCNHSRKWSLTPTCTVHGGAKPSSSSSSSSSSSLSSNGVWYHFDTIPQLIDYFTIHHLPLNGCEHMALLYPVPVRLL